MQPLRLAPTLAVFTVILFACDPEQDFPDDAFTDELELDDGQIMLGDMPSERFELEAASNDQTTEESASCGVWGPGPGASWILANDQNVGTVELSISSVPTTAYYDFDVVQYTSPYLSSFDIQRLAYPYSIVAHTLHNLGLYLFIASDGDGYDLTLQAPANATPGSTYATKVRLNDESGAQCNYHWVYMHIADCTAVGWWSTNPWPTPWFDDANCYVAPLPQGQTSFVWNNSWYVEETAGNHCAIGVFDGANCYIGSAPGGHTAFIWNNALYYTP